VTIIRTPIFWLRIWR